MHTQTPPDLSTIVELFQHGVGCAQIITGEFSEETGLSRQQLRKLGGAFDGGMGRGESCGAVIGALAVLGLVYGHSDVDEGKQKALLMEKSRKFQEKFCETYSSCLCRQILGYDLSKDEEAAIIFEKGLLFQLCPRVVSDSIAILKEILEEP